MTHFSFLLNWPSSQGHDIPKSTDSFNVIYDLTLQLFPSESISTKVLQNSDAGAPLEFLIKYINEIIEEEDGVKLMPRRIYWMVIRNYFHIFKSGAGIKNFFLGKNSKRNTKSLCKLLFVLDKFTYRVKYKKMYEFEAFREEQVRVNFILNLCLLNKLQETSADIAAMDTDSSIRVILKLLEELKKWIFELDDLRNKEINENFEKNFYGKFCVYLHRFFVILLLTLSHTKSSNG